MTGYISTQGKICGFWIFKPGTLQPACAWFLKIDPVWIIGMHVRVCMRVCVCVCVCVV